MAPCTNRTMAHTDATKEHRTFTSAKASKPRLHKRCTLRPKCFRPVRQIEVPECQSITSGPTCRKVSLEELQQDNNSDSSEEAFSTSISNWPRFENNTPSFMSPTRKKSSSSHQTLVSPAASPRLLPRSSSSPASLKRRAPSMCLASLLAQEKRSNHNSSSLVTPTVSVCSSLDDSTGSGGSSGVWGHFVELQHEDGDANNSSTRRRQRRPVIRGPRSSEKLEGFFLTLPDVDEAIDQLQNMSF